MNAQLRESLKKWLESDDPKKRAHAERRLAAAGPEEPVAYPSLARMAGNAARAVTSFIASGFALASDAERERRLAICRAPCEYLDVAQDRCRHGKCGCFVAVKTKAAAQKCPINKW